MMEAVTTALGTVIDWVGTVVSSLTSAEGELSALLPLMAIGIAISALMLGKLDAEGKSGKIGEGCDANTEVISYIA